MNFSRGIHFNWKANILNISISFFSFFCCEHGLTSKFEMCCLKMLLRFASQAKGSTTELRCSTRVSLQGQTKSPRSSLPFIPLCFPHPNHVHRPLQLCLDSSCFRLVFSVSIVLVLLRSRPVLPHPVPAGSHLPPPLHCLPVLHFCFCLTSSFMPFGPLSLPTGPVMVT